MSDHDAPFFVGYAPTPIGLRRPMKFVACSLMLLAVVAAALIASGQRDPGAGAWDLEHLTEYTGVLREHPYPMLQTTSQSILLVDQGKVGSQARVRGLHGQKVKIRGTRIERNAFVLIELTEGDDAVQVVNRSIALDEPIVGETSATLIGEIIDPKCHSGAMKPGDGKTHKACAALCIRGGIPPVFLASNGSTDDERFLLVDEHGRGLTEARLEELLPFVADRVEIHGIVARQGDCKLLQITRGAIRRLN